MFKAGQKVVYVGTNKVPLNPRMKYPEEGEIVTIHAYCKIFKGSVDISEYL